MYAKRVQIHNYGPIDRFDVSFPFEGDNPKPVLLVGENGSGKSIVLSHIVNGLLVAQQVAYPETPEVEAGKVYKIRSNSYIKSGSEYYFGKVDFEGGLFMGEIRAQRKKQETTDLTKWFLEGDVEEAWNDMGVDENGHLASNIDNTNINKIKELFSKNCVLYFPPNRFEEPAWLNEENLNAKAQYMDLKHFQGYANRKIINYSPLHDNQNWLFEVIYDRATFEIQTSNINLPIQSSNATIPLRVFNGYSGNATSTYETALWVVRSIVKDEHNIRFGIGRRHNRTVSIQSGAGKLVPNIFQLSSGETALLNLFLSILRDFDLTGQPFKSSADIRGIAVVDEIDLHLHAVHQHEILPALIRMFPKVQFVVTTHSPLFVLGMNKLFGEDGFAIYRLPEGRQISPEEFSEFGDAYQAFTETVRHSRDIQTAIEQAQKPIAFVEGATDEKYIKRASELLSKEAVLGQVEVRDGGGSGNLKKIWNNFRSPLPDLIPQKVLFIFDCDTARESDDKGNLLQRTIPLQNDNPAKKGVENLFSKETLERAKEERPEFIDIDPERTPTRRGALVTIPEEWTVNEDEKMKLCIWLCENGSVEDFEGFNIVFDLLEELLVEDSEQSEVNTETAN
ncbi:MAG: AAA family ATPase [Chloroflexi bacterium]|nr:AAA family ATPase [Chloroflexota bacterium]